MDATGLVIAVIAVVVLCALLVTASPPAARPDRTVPAEHDVVIAREPDSGDPVGWTGEATSSAGDPGDAKGGQAPTRARGWGSLVW